MRARGSVLRCCPQITAVSAGVIAMALSASSAFCNGKADRLKQSSSEAFASLAEIAPTDTLNSFPLSDHGKPESLSQAAPQLDNNIDHTIAVASTDGAFLPAYGAQEFGEFVALIPLETAAVVGGTLALGFAEWNWGNSSFYFDSEGFFGEDTLSGGMDKLGHAFGSALMADFFTASMNRHTTDSRRAALTGSVMSFGVMTMVEMFDGFSGDHGFSYEDVVMNTIGVTFSYLRNSVPGLREKIDFRLEYVPSGFQEEAFSPHSDYAGQKYVLALKLSGFEQFRETPLRFFELQAGYFTQGFTLGEHRLGIAKSREPYLAIGLNLEEIFLGQRQPDESKLREFQRGFFQHIQVPYTYATFNRDAYNY